MTRPFDLSLYLVTDPALCASRGLEETVRLAVSGGATMVQLRDPDAPKRVLVEQARALKRVLSNAGIPFLINDCVDVALAAGADGVHLGQGDMSALDARALMGPRAIIGLSVGNLVELEASREALAAVDYLGTGPFAVTGTKPDAGAAIGEAGLRKVREHVDMPIVAIGGIGLGNAAAAIRAGADGVAIVSAICAAADPSAAARKIVDEVATARLSQQGG